MNIRTGQGETFYMYLSYLDENGEPFDLSEHNVVWRMFNSTTGALIAESVGLAGSEGDITIHVPFEVTTEWPTGKHPYVLIDNTPEGDAFWVLKGEVEVRAAHYV